MHFCHNVTSMRIIYLPCLSPCHLNENYLPATSVTIYLYEYDSPSTSETIFFNSASPLFWWAVLGFPWAAMGLVFPLLGPGLASPCLLSSQLSSISTSRSGPLLTSNAIICVVQLNFYFCNKIWRFTNQFMFNNMTKLNSFVLSSLQSGENIVIPNESQCCWTYFKSHHVRILGICCDQK